MDYLVQQISWYLVIAFLLGALIGWIIGNSVSTRKAAEAEDEPAGD